MRATDSSVRPMDPSPADPPMGPTPTDPQPGPPSDPQPAPSPDVDPPVTSAADQPTDTYSAEDQPENQDEPQADSPVEYQADSPVEYQADSPVEYQADSPVEYQVDSPVEYQAESPAEYQVDDRAGFAGVEGDERFEADEPVDSADAPVADGVVDRAPGDIPEPPPADLLLADEAESYRARWRELQLLFVDDPQAAAEKADDLVGDAIESLTRSLAAQRADLAEWRSSSTVDTEQLRVSVKQYQGLLEKLLSRA